MKDDDFEILDVVWKRIAMIRSEDAARENVEVREKKGTEASTTCTPEGAGECSDIEEAASATDPGPVIPGAFACAGPDEAAAGESNPVDNGVEAVEQELAEATALDLPQADAMDPQHRTNNRSTEKLRRSLLGLCLFATVVLAVMLSVVAVAAQNAQGNNENNSISPTTSPTANPSSSPTAWTLKRHVELLLTDETVRSIEADPLSPQALALEFIYSDPNLDTYPDWRIRQRLALAAIYYSLNGEAWNRNDNWLNHSVPECEWYMQSSFSMRNAWSQFLPGFLSDFANPTPRCDAEGRYNHLWLDQNNLAGTLPLELYFFLTSLQTLSLEFSTLEGSLSTHIGLLTNLEGLSTPVHQTPTSMPSELGLLTKLRCLKAAGNDFVGTVPSEIWQLTNLTTLDLSANPELRGSIPTEIGKLTNLYWFAWYMGVATGTIPTEIGLLKKLTWLLLFENHFSGSMPATLNNFSDLKILALYDNAFTGEVPSEFGLFPSLELLTLQDNQFTGTIPTELGLLSSIKLTLTTRNNQLSGSIPTELGLLSDLQEIDLRNNMLTGIIPSELGQLSRLQHLAFANNSLEGLFPSELRSASETMHTLSLDGNPMLSGNIPQVLCKLNSTCIDHALDRCETKQGLSFDCTGLLCGCTCSCEET